jgi:hypothetical protein
MLASFDPDDPFWRQWREYERLRRQLEDIERWNSYQRGAGIDEALRQEESVRSYARYEADLERIRRQAGAEKDILLFQSPKATLEILDRATTVFNEVRAFGHGPWGPFSNSAFRQVLDAHRAADQLRLILGPWQDHLGSAFLADLTTSLTLWGPVEAETPIAEIVRRAVDDALKKHKKQIDYRWLLALVLSVLYALVQLIPTGPDPALIATLEAVQANVTATRLATEVLNTRWVLRSTRIHTRPISTSMVVRSIPSGAEVVLLERHKKWSKVRLLREEIAGGRRAEFGWLLNKYLSRAP